LARLKRLFVLGDLLETAYRTERDRLRAQLLALTPPVMPDLEWAAEILQDFGRIWEAATLKERRQIVHTLLEAVYLDADRGPHGLHRFVSSVPSLDCSNGQSVLPF